MKKGIVNALFALGGAVAGIVGTERSLKKKIKEGWEMSDKHLELFLLMNQWVKVKQEGKNLSSYFEKKGYREIAIYGMSYAGETLADELKKSTTNIKYGIDQKAEQIYAEFDVVLPNEKLEHVDAIVVTPVKFFDEIEEQLRSKVSCPIISLEDILYEI